MQGITQRTSADRSASSRTDWHGRGLHTADTEPVELPRSLDPIITLRVGHPLTLAEAIDVQQKIAALIARRPASIALDVAGLMPTDEMGVLMLPAMAHDAAEEGVAVVLANPSRPLRDRLAQLGVRNLTFVYRPAPTAPTEDGWAGPMNGMPWARHAPPRGTSTASEVWRHDVVSPAALTFSRSLLRRRLMSSPLPPDMDEGYVDVLLLAYEELTSNAIRHGRLPVYAMVTTMDGGWLIDVVDAATECAPRPPVDRDPAQGGLGLHLVARLCTTHGWWTEHNRKHVWALVQPGDNWGSALDGRL